LAKMRDWGKKRGVGNGEWGALCVRIGITDMLEVLRYGSGEWGVGDALRLNLYNRYLISSAIRPTSAWAKPTLRRAPFGCPRPSVPGGCRYSPFPIPYSPYFYIFSGASTPRMPSTFRSTIWVASTRMIRAFCTAGSSVITRQ